MGRLVDALSKRVEALTVGDGAIAGTDVGPLVCDAAKSEVQIAFDRAISQGAQVVARAGDGEGDGHYFAPTLSVGSPDLDICREEVFGPITTVLAATDLDHAIELANATAFGLTASVFSSNEQTIRRCVDEIDAGLVKANGPTTGSEIHVPFGGLKDSSFPAPREQNASSAADFFTWSKSAYLRTAVPWSA